MIIMITVATTAAPTTTPMSQEGKDSGFPVSAACLLSLSLAGDSDEGVVVKMTVLTSMSGLFVVLLTATVGFKLCVCRENNRV